MTRHSALIVGGTSGIGRACAEALAGAGFAITVVGRDGARARGVAQEIHPDAGGAGVDATDDLAVARLFAATPPPTHVVVSLAGGSALGRFAELEADALRHALETKLFAYMTVARHALRVLPPDGSLTLITGVAGVRPAPGAACLVLANAAINALVETLAVESAPARVNAVAPGTTDTPAWARMPAEAREAMFANMASRIPLRRIGRSQDVAEAVLALVHHPFLTGLTLPCDGGLRLI